jgi:hypothetical protein
MRTSRAGLGLIVIVVLFAAAACGTSQEEDSQSPLRVERASCYQALDRYADVLAAAEAGDFDAPEHPNDSPFCSCTVGLADEVPLLVLRKSAESETIVTEAVEWVVSDPSVAVISPDGVLSFLTPGEVEVRVCVEGVCSEPFPVDAVEDPEVVQLEIFSNYYFPIPLFDDIGVGLPECFDCDFGWSLRLLVGSTENFFARGILETGSWVDLTDEVTWHSSVVPVAGIDDSGLLTALFEGSTEITATYEALTSNTVDVEVLAEAILVDLFIYRHSSSGILKVGAIDQLHADAYYDPPMPPMLRDVTEEVEWILSDLSRASVSPEGVLTGLAPGPLTIQAAYEGKTSNEISLEIWEESEMEYCDPENPNRAIWADEFNRVILETDCDIYPDQDVVSIRYTIEENQPHPWGILDPCLDLVVLGASDEIVRTLRFEGCGDLPFAVEAGMADVRDPVYQYSTIWDRKDDAGVAVPPGIYTLAGRFYIYYDPVVRLQVTLTD